MYLRFNNFYHPDAPTGTGVATPAATDTGGSDKESIIEFLGEDDDIEKDIIPLDDDKDKDKGDRDKGKDKSKEKEKDKEKDKDTTKEEDNEDTDEDEDEEDELTALEEELEPPTEEQLELVTPVRRKEILKKYPALFKDFPYLEKAYYREQQFTELLPTIDDAREAVEARTTLENFEKDLTAGNTENILNATKRENPKAFLKLVDKYMDTLAKVDEKAYHHVIGNLTKHTIMAMVAEGRKSGNEALQSAAAVLNQYMFGTSDFKPPVELSDTTDPKSDNKDDELKKKEQEFTKRRFESSRDDLNTRVNNSLRNTIDANIDPKKSMTDWVRKTASREALETLENLISKDSRFKILVDKMWERAFETNFSKDSIDRIKSAYHSKAKTLLPSVIKKARNEALRGLGKRVKDDDDIETTSNKGPVTSGRPRSQTNSGGKSTKTGEVPKGMSTLDFLNSD